MPIGVLLLADTIPSLTIALLAPFLPFYIKCVECTHFIFATINTPFNSVFHFVVVFISFHELVRSVRMTLACLLSATGFIVVAAATHQWHALLGIIITSLSSGLGETSMLAYTAKFNR